MSKPERLEQALRDAGVSGVLGVRMGSFADRDTWEVFFDGTATQADVTAAQGVIDTIDADSDTLVQDKKRQRLSRMPGVDAVWRELMVEIRALADRLGDTGVATTPAFRARLETRFNNHPQS